MKSMVSAYRRRVCVENEEPSLTKQSFKDECNINVIVGKYLNYGVTPTGNARQPRYGDFTEAGDYHDALNRVRAAEASFAALPAQFQKACQHDPGKVVEVLEAATEEELREYGIGFRSPREEGEKVGGEIPPQEEKAVDDLTTTAMTDREGEGGQT